MTVEISGIIQIGGHLGEEAPKHYTVVGDAMVWIEAQPDKAARCAENVAQYGHRAISALLWNVTGTRTKFNIARNSRSSSIREPRLHIQHFGNQVRVREQIDLTTTTYDDLVKEHPYLGDGRYNHLIVDAQGAEFEVLCGIGPERMQQFVKLTVEVSNAEEYAGQAQQPAIDAFLWERGYTRPSRVGNRHGDVEYFRRPAVMSPLCGFTPGVPLVLLRENQTSRVFVETGVCKGTSAEVARASGLFDKIHSIEVPEHPWKACRTQHEGDPRIILHHVASETNLSDILGDYPDGVILWLDTHFSREDTGGGRDYLTHLQANLQCIEASPGRFRHTILMDDARVFTKEQATACAQDNSEERPSTIEKCKLVDRLKGINPDFNIVFHPVRRGVLVAVPKSVG